MDHTPTLRNKLGNLRDPGWALRIIGLVSEQVNVLHQQGLVHGMLHPEAILIGPDDVVQVVSVEAGAKLNPTVLPYLAPERSGRMNRPVDARADLYSIGAILYELLSGR